MDFIWDAIKDLLKEIINSNLENMFTDVNNNVSTIAAQVGTTPQGWNSSIFNMIRNLSDTVVLPIAGLILTFVLCYELITMVTEKNNMHDVDTFMFFKYIFKCGIAVYLVSHTFDITMAIFDVAQTIVNSASGAISHDTHIDISSALTNLGATMDGMGIGDLMLLVLETALVSMAMNIVGIIITVILYGRMIEIYITTSVAPIPFATMTNREWGSIGNNYLKSLFALGFQGFFMMVCVGIYAVLIRSFTISDDLHTTLFTIAAYTVILCFSLFKTSTLSKSIFQAH